MKSAHRTLLLPCPPPSSLLFKQRSFRENVSLSLVVYLDRIPHKGLLIWLLYSLS